MSNEPSGNLQRLVLVADDDRIQRKQIVGFLNRIRISTLEAHDGAAALEAIARHHPAVILLDVHMAGMDGIEAAKRAAGIAGGAKIILMSGFPDWVREANKAHVGAFAVIEKPIPLKMLAQFIDEAFLGLAV